MPESDATAEYSALVLEAYGVDPDIVVERDPRHTSARRMRSTARFGKGPLMSELAYLGLARHADAREIAEMSRDLIEQGLTWSWTPARVQHFIGGPESSVVVARREQRIAAFAIMHFGEDVAHLNLLAVAPEHRRQGLGRKLMEWLTATATEAGVFRINLELRTHNDAARHFYERLGFTQLGVVQGYYQGREAALRMSHQFAQYPTSP